MEFGCLCLASQIWVKQAQPAKCDTKLYNKQTELALQGTVLHARSLAWLMMKPQYKNESSETSALSSWCEEKPLLKCTLEEADVHCGPGLQEMYRPGHMEVDGGILLVSTGPQRAHSSTRGEGVGRSLPPAP